ncbi:MAG: Stk1 family PASTA domain-containing Ser/Thr kinase [Firmicutes bacterium]|nr:Stk1 family PASTA domain-containing Ser/Thr kinase [Bacillota bacterium]
MIGKILGNRYEIVEKIGGGGMAFVYKAKCRLLNRYVAIKILRPEFTNDEEFINKFRRESQSAASLSHHNIVNIYDVGSEDNVYYIVMEYVKGKTLKKLIREKGKLSPKRVINIAIEIAEALNHAHENHIVHRDIKPHNIMVTDDGRIKVTDFGIARAASTSTVTNTSNVIGSVHYFSPEQARGGYTDAKSDIYSLGIVMYEMLTGRVPFEGESPISIALKHIQEDIIPPGEIDKNIPKSIDNIVRKAVKKDQSLRYNSSDEILKDLRKAKQFVNEDIVEFKDYNNSPTRVIPAIKDDMIDNKEKKDKKNEKGKNKKNNSKKLITIFAIVAALIFTGVIAGGYLIVKDYLIVEEVKVPNLVGKSLENATKDIEKVGLKLEIEDRKHSNTIKKGYIIEQSEPLGANLKVDSTVRVVVSEGPDLVKTPKLVGNMSNEAEILLSEVGLKKGEITYEASDDYPIDVVIKQNPPPQEMLEKGSEIDYVISSGPEKKYIPMPDLVGLTEQDAKRRLISKGFLVGEIKYKANNDIPEGLVSWQSYPVGTEVEKNTTINLEISTGSSESDKNKENEAKDKPNDTSVELTIKLPDDDKEVKVDVYKEQNDKKELIYSKKHKSNEESIKVPISGKGTVKYIVYFNGEKKDEVEYNFKEDN